MQPTDTASRRVSTWTVSLLAIAVVGAAEMLQLSGAVFATLLVAVVVLAFSQLREREAAIITALCLTLTFAGLLINAHPDSSTEEIVERLLIGGAITLSAVIMVRRNRLNRQLLEAEARHVALFEGAADGILTVDASGQIRSANPAAKRIFGFVPGELCGQSIDILIPSEYRDRHRRAMADYAAGRLDIAHLIGVTRDVMAQRRDGTIFPIEINVSRINTAEGEEFSAVIRDISERKSAELLIHESQRTLSTLMSNLQGMAYRCKYDPSWTALFVSQGSLELTGYEPHEIEASRVIDYERIIYPADRELVANAVQEAVVRDCPFNITYRIVHRSGDIRWVQERGSAVRGHGGQIEYLEGFIFDITREKRSEDALRESEQRFRNIADSTPFMIWASGPDKGISFANARILDYFDKSMDEMVGSGWIDVLHPNDRDRVLAEYASAFDSWQPFETEYRVRRRDGEWRWLLLHGVPRFAPGGDFTGYIGSAMDVTERHKRVEELRESEMRFRSIADSTPFMIFATGVNGENIFVNRRLMEFTGLALDDLLGEGWLAQVHPEDRPRILAEYTSAFHSRIPLQYEFRLRRADGAYRWIVVAGNPRFAPDGDFMGYIGSGIDIHERKEAEIALRESEARFRNVADLTPSVIWVSDQETRCTFMNKKWTEITGQSMDEALGFGWTETIHPDDRVKTIEYITQAIALREPYGNEFRVRDTEGGWRTLLNTGSPRFGPGNAYLGYIGSCVDVTDRRQADHLIWKVAKGVSAATGDEFFRSLALNLTEALGSDFVAIGELSEFDDRHVRTIALVRDGAITDDLEYELPGTPCRVVLRDGAYACVEGVQEAFPEDGFLREEGIQCYIGQALRGNDGRDYGILWVLYRRPVADVNLAISLLRIFAVRAAAELERRRASAALRLSEERFRQSVKAGDFVVFQQDTELRYTWIHNSKGLPDADVQGRTDYDMLPEHEARVLTDIKRGVLRTGVGIRTEVEVSPAGEPVVYDLIVEPDVDETGRVSGLTCISTDITERKRMQAALAESENRFRRLFEDSPVAMVEYDLSRIRQLLGELETQGVRSLESYISEDFGRAQQVMFGIQNVSLNRQALMLLGARDFSALLETAEQVVTPASSRAFARFIDAIWRGCTSYEDEAELGTVDGVRRVVIAKSMIVPGNETTWARVVTSMVDVTAQRRAEQSLRQSEARYRHMFDESPMAKLEVDLSYIRAELAAYGFSSGGDLGERLTSDADLLNRCLERIRFKSVNATSVRVFRAQSAEHLRDNITRLFTEGTTQAFVEFLGRLWRGETTYEIETSFRALDGELRTGDVHCVLTTESTDDWSQVLVAILDVTESRKAEDELGRAKRLETAGRLAGQIAHDFNNLLGPLVAYPEILQAKFPDEGRAHEMLRDMQQAALQIAEINQELLTLSRRGHYNTEPLDLNKLVLSATRTAEIPHTVTLDLQLHPDEIIIRGGSAQLMRLLLNLIKNAVEAMDDVGVLTVKSDCLYLDEPMRGYSTIERGEYARVDISDTGCGIPEDALAHIFEPFFTTKKTDRKRGTGLGLPVVHSVVEDHNGYIDVTSSPGRGSTFSLYFPLFRGTPTVCETTSTIAEGHGERVLVVDDDPLQRRIAQTALERVGYQVTAMESGEAAVAHIADHPADIVILDMVMTGIDGAETLRRIRELYPDQPAMILTGYSSSERAQAALQLGQCELLAKPIQASALTRAIHKMLSGRVGHRSAQHNPLRSE